jgi:hypothetical protein
MRNALAGMLLGSLGLLVAGPAAAGPLVSAELRVSIDGLAAVAFPGTGATGSAAGALAASVDAGTGFAGTAITSCQVCAPPISGIYVFQTGNDAGQFTGTPIGGVAEFRGIYEARGFGDLVLLGIPLRVGGDTTATSTSGVSVTAISGTWTAGTASVWLPGATAPVVRTGSNELTANGAGRLLLVSPFTVLTGLSGGTSFAGFGFLELVYVPEPRALVLIAGGIALLAAGRARRS